MLAVTLLGTAATMPLPDRALTAAYAACNGHAILFDCGEGTQAAARRAGVNLMKVEAICLTHYHGDHIFGLPGLLQTLACQERTKQLTILGPRGLTEIWQVLHALTGPLPYPVRLMEADTRQDAPVMLDELCRGWAAGAKLFAVPTKHRVTSCGYRLELMRTGRFLPEKAKELHVPVKCWKALQHGAFVTLEDGTLVRPEQVLGAPRRGLRFVFSGDTAPCTALQQAAENADLLICEGTYPSLEYAEQAKQWGHSTFEQSATLAKNAGAKRLWLAHYSPIITEPETYLPLAREIFPAAECGFDGKSIVLRFDEEQG